MGASIVVMPWDDPVLDALGYDPRSWYAETFWLPTLGPTSLLFLRHVADRFERDPKPITLELAETSTALGLGARDGNHSPLVRSITRLAQFELALDSGYGEVAVRRILPPVNRRHVRRLPVGLQALHAEWVESHGEGQPADAARRRARRVAFTLLEEGDDPDRVERALQSIGFHPALASESARWARRRHQEALDAVNATAS